MAIYDNNGTADCKMDKLYDSDGTVEHQIGTVYDNDGTTDNVIYRAIFRIIENGVLNSRDVPSLEKYTAGAGGSIAYNSGYITITSSSSGSSAGYVSYTTSVLPTSNYKTMYITFSASVGHTSGSEFIAIGSINKNLAKGTHSKQTMTFDISGLTEDYSLTLCCRAWVASTTAMNYYDIWLE